MWKWIRVFVWTGIFLLFLLSLLLAGLQTHYAKEKLRDWLCQMAKSQGMELSIGAINGGPPLRWTLENVVFKPTNSDIIEISELRFSLSFLPLLKKKLYFKRIVLRDGIYTFSETHGFIIQKTSQNLAFGNLGAPYLHQAKPACVSTGDAGECKNGNTEAAKSQIVSHFLYIPCLDLPWSIAVKDLIISNAKIIDLEHRTEWIYTLHATGNLNAHAEKFFLNAILSSPIWKKNCKVQFSIAAAVGGGFSCDHLQIDSDFLKAKAKGAIYSDYTLKELTASFTLNSLSWLNPHLSGSITTDISYNPSQMSFDFSTEKVAWDEHLIDICKGSIQATSTNDAWQGNAFLKLEQEEVFLNGQANFCYQDKQFALTKISIKGPELIMQGQLQGTIFPFTMEGRFDAGLSNLRRFSAWTKGEHLAGTLTLSAQFVHKTNAELYIHATNLEYDQVLISELNARAHLYDLWNQPHGSVNCNAEKIYFPKLFLSSLDFFAYSEKENWKFDLKGNGQWKDPLFFAVNGKFKKENSFIVLDMDTVNGSILKKDLFLTQPFTVRFNHSEFDLTSCNFTLGEGNFSATALLSSLHSDICVKAEHFPLDFLSLFTQEFSTAGNCSLDAAIEEKECMTQGRICLLLEEASLLPSGKSIPLRAKGNLQLNLDNHVLQIHSTLKASKEQFFEWTATLPIKGCLYPFTMTFDQEKPLSSEIVMEGNLEEIFDFIQIGNHKFSGFISSHLFLSHTLTSPSLIGKLTFQEGSYENYVTGTYLQNIQALATAENQQFTLVDFIAKDKEKGTVTAQGELRLRIDEKFPYYLSLNFHDLNMLNYDSFTSNFSGPLTLYGDMKKASAEGHLIVSKANFIIPDELPPDIPVLPITYIHTPPHLKKNHVSSIHLFPIDLNIELSASHQIFVRGRGLTSEWEGNVHLGGNNEHIAANGSLRLLKGEFDFSGKVFNLTQGELTFAHKNSQEAFLSLSGNLTLRDAIITVILRGPLSSPQLTFQSVPSMPTSSILSRILFNKDIADISPFQAIQLAQMIVTLSGSSGPNVLEKIRKSLGIDRLNIVSGSSDEISVQIGKYLTKGVLVTLSQSADSSQVIVEVDLSQGFIFQAETQEEDEGKFTLKWNRNY